eukprot:jgi/Picre1/28285/NNA_003691.t1
MGDTFSEVEKGNSSRGMNGADEGLSAEKLFGGQHFGFLRRASNGSASYARGSVSFLKDGVEDVMSKFDRVFHRMNEWARRNWIGRFFAFKARKAKFTTEFRAGTISFLMIAYVLALNPQILETTAGTCDPATMCYKEEYDLRGYACLFTTANPKAVECMGELRLSLTTATAAASLISCFIIGFFANLPLGLAPGIGINIYFAYQVVGQETLTYQQALVAVFIEGFIFIALSVSGIRGGIMRYMPANIAFAGSVGMGLLLAYTGLRNLGVVVFDGTTLTTLGGCPPEDRLYIYVASTNFLPGNFTGLSDLERSAVSILSNITPSDVDEASANVYACASNEMRSATMWLGIAGGVIMALLTAWRVKGALFIGVAFVTIISWIPGHAASYLGAGSSIPGGAMRMETFKQVVAAPTLAGTGLQWDWSAVGNGHFWLVLFTLLYIDILDCTGILLIHGVPVG